MVNIVINTFDLLLAGLQPGQGREDNFPALKTEELYAFTMLLVSWDAVQYKPAALPFWLQCSY